jgi:hypothetical protein
MDIRQLKKHSHLTRGQYWLAAIGALSVVGTFAELTILGHYQEPTQVLPYGALIALAWGLRKALVSRHATTLRIVRMLGLASALVAALGAGLHYNANLGLARDVDPTISGLSYLWSGVHGKIPFLAPLVLAQLSLIVIAATFVRTEGDTTTC